MPRSHKPSTLSRESHTFSMASTTSPKSPAKRSARHKVRRCNACGYFSRFTAVTCQVCQGNIAVLHIDAAIAQTIMSGRKVAAGEIRARNGHAGLQPTPDHCTPDPASHAPYAPETINILTPGVTP
jgi:hypothetical protein